ncbi:MAG: protein kinase [Candidatus Acidiferrales bacterium]|jgi:serine/threonine-protein kinase
MAIQPGNHLGPYEILSAIGAGGMGEVYRARDAKLGRDVALKVLPEAFARDAERMARFQREAKVLASLNHTNIASIYGLEDSSSTHALVMELVEGPTLADRIRVGPIPISEALPIAKQMCDALEYAHERGIVHRDLKPANVKVTNDDAVKVLDFGLAKALEGDASSIDIANSPTVSRMATQAGVLLGTAAYMSPEQAKGKAVDRRADIWAFGCVLYEMLTGQMAFRGETVTDTLAAVIKEEPDWSQLPAATPIRVRVLLRRCLQKDLKQRLQAIGDARISLDEVLAGAPDPSLAGAARISASFWRRALVLSLGALLLGLAVATLVTWNLKPTPPQPVTRTVITLPPGQQLAGLEIGPAVVISPDGTHLAYVATQGGTQQLYLRPMDSLEAKPVSGTEGALSPFFSPDGQSLGFFAGGKLKKVSVSGGAALTLGDAADPRGASWGSQGTIVFAPSATGALQKVSDGGGIPQPLTRLEKGEVGHRFPEFVPGGKAVVFVSGTSSGNWTDAQVVVQSVVTGERRDVIQGGTQPGYAPSGYLVYVRGGNLMAVPFDSRRLELTGAAVPVVEGIREVPLTGAAQYSVSLTGSLAYIPGGAQATQNKLVWVSRDGAEQSLAAPVRAYRFPRLSPNGQRVAVNTDGQLWLYDLSRGTLSRFTFEGNDLNTIALWTPDGMRIAFNSNKEGPQHLFWQLVNGTGGAERLTIDEYNKFPSSFSPDGQLLAYTEVNPTTGSDIWVLRLGDRKAQPFLQTAFNESAPRFSPDGRWLAYVSDESGRYEVYVQPYPGPGGKWQISTEGGTEPVWNRNGRELFYRNGNKMMAVDVTAQPSFSAGKPRVLFEGQYSASGPSLPSYDVSADGQRFLMLKPSEQAGAAPTQINVVLNWFEELKRRVAAGTK